MSRSYIVLFEREDHGAFAAYVPALPGCPAEGETYDEAFANIRAEIDAYIAGLKADALPAPEPRTKVATIEEKAA